MTCPAVWHAMLRLNEHFANSFIIIMHAAFTHLYYLRDMLFKMYVTIIKVKISTCTFKSKSQCWFKCLSATLIENHFRLSRNKTQLDIWLFVKNFTCSESPLTQAPQTFSPLRSAPQTHICHWASLPIITPSHQHTQKQTRSCSLKECCSVYADVCLNLQASVSHMAA